ncbi:chitinase [Xanthomonas sontii]|nr:chitinase [Xanthomonas sontii]UZK09153.1 chitinase [Xanthomonas sontii]
MLFCCLVLAGLAPGQTWAAACSGVAAWNPATIYAAGDTLTYASHLYRANGPIWNTAPTYCTSCGWYQDLGTCDGSSSNQPPSVAMTAPTSGTRFAVGTTIALQASANDPDGSVARVEFFRGSTSLGSVSGAPYTLSWSGAAAGDYSLTAVATDNAGARTTSAAVAISIAAPSTDTTAPSVPTGLAAATRASNAITLTWNAASDNAGGSGLAGYDILRDGNRVGTSSTTGYTDSALIADTAYAYAVRARDNAGNVSASSATLSVRTLPASAGGGKRVIGYFTQWGIYGRNYQVRDIQASGAAGYLTHINYAFGNVRNNRCEVGVTQPSDSSTGAGGDAFADYTKAFSAAQSVDGVGDTWDQPLRGNWNQLKKLKAAHPGLKVLISLGGWTWSRGFSSAARAENRQAFVASCIDAYIRGNLPVTDGAGGSAAAAGVFDGIDIDWEYPVACGIACGSAEDRQNFTALLAEFRRRLDQVRPGLLLTVAVGAGIDKIRVTDPNLYAPYLDYLNVMTYDFHGAWDPQTNHHSALFESSADPSSGDQRYYNSNDAIQAFLDRGVPAAKLNLGIGFYGRGWTNVPNVNHGLYQSGSAAPGTYEAGIEDYKVLRGRAGTSYVDAQAHAHWKYDGSTFWSYDNPALVTEKMNYVKTQGLGGAFFWEFSGDYQGELLKTMGQGLQ